MFVQCGRKTLRALYAPTCYIWMNVFWMKAWVVRFFVFPPRRAGRLQIDHIDQDLDQLDPCTSRYGMLWICTVHIQPKIHVLGRADDMAFMLVT